jgi:uncharacterized protein YcbK (DUF882 family)
MSEFPFFSDVDPEMDPAFMAKLIELRKALDFPFPVTSSLRSDDRHSMHNLGRAVDINVYGDKAFRLIAAAPSFGFTGIGVSQASRSLFHKRFIHLDDRDDDVDFPAPRIWSY